MKWQAKTYATRLSIYIISLATLIFGLTMVLYYVFASNKIKERAIYQSEMMLDDLMEEASNPLLEVQTMVKSIAWMIGNEPFVEERIPSILQHIVSCNDFIYGSAIAYIPNQDEPPMMLYASKGDVGIDIDVIDTLHYQYTKLEWFSTPVRTRKEYWSDAYFDKGAGDIFMCTYSVPIADDMGTIYAVLTADISLNNFRKRFNELRPHKSFEAYMLSQHMKCMIGFGDNEVNQKERLSEVAVLRLKSRPNDIEHESSDRYAESFYSPELDAHVFYTDIPITGWSIWCVYPQDDMVNDFDISLYGIFMIAFWGIVALFLTTYFAIKRLVAPLSSFAKSAREISTGNFKVELPKISTQDEMLDLRLAMEYMQNSLEEYVERLKQTIVAKQKIEQELLIAHEIQMDMLPEIAPELKDRYNIDLYAVLKPVKEVGGDMYGFLVEEGKLFFFIGDVSGKGVPAALFMMTTCSLLKALFAADITPEMAIRRLNAMVAISNKHGMFVTCFYGILDIQTGRLDYCNAGHNPPVLLTPEGDATFLEVETNLAVGLLNDYSFVGQSINISNGTKIVLYTDGIVEAEDSERRLYSDEKFIELLANNPVSEAETIIRNIEQSVSEHVLEAPQSDDIAIMVLGYGVEPQQNKIEIGFGNYIGSLQQVEAFANKMAEVFNLPEDVAGEVRLAVEEILANIVMYGYTDGQSDTILVVACKEANTLIVQITDCGKAFDPTLVDEPDLENSSVDDQVGGLGIYLVKSLMDSVKYERVGNRNRLTFEKII